MSTPEHPNTIIVKNDFYKKGLLQSQIYNYYLSVKDNLLNEVDNREIMIFFATDTNQYIIKRKDPKTNQFFKLTKDNYETLLSGRTLSIHSTMNENENFGIIDIDYHDFDVCKEVTMEIYDSLISEFEDIRIRFTGKESFHLVPKFDRYININSIKSILKDILEKRFGNKYLINKMRNLEKVNIDLAPNKLKGGYVTLYSLSVLGLKCMEVSRRELRTFEKEDAKIK